jgi:hypothetical protein
MRTKPSKRIVAVFCLAMMMVISVLLASAALAQATQQAEVTESVPKAPENDFTVSIYKALDTKKAERLSFNDKYKQGKTDMDVEIVISYYNWAVNDDDYWNRQLNIETKTKEGDVIEKIVKSGFGDLGYVKKGDPKTQDVFRKEKITMSGNVARAVMVDMEIGEVEKTRYRALLQKFVLAQ